MGTVRPCWMDLTHQRHCAEYVTVRVISVLATVHKGQRESVEPFVNLPRELGILAPRVAATVQRHRNKVESLRVCRLKRRCSPIGDGSAGRPGSVAQGADVVFANLQDKRQAFDVLAQTVRRVGVLLFQPESGYHLVHTSSQLWRSFALVSQRRQ
ncbi:hypothetical protein NKDENANG_03935 [Candidatus Entotheonellaceae bacterium PAL068K]